MTNREPEQPEFSDATILTYLSGFSGAQVALMESPDHSRRFVRKFAAGEAPIARLVDQKLKIERLARVLAGQVSFPAILGERTEQGFYWYDMEFVAGIDGIIYLSAGCRENAHAYRQAIESVLGALKDDRDQHAASVDLCSVITTKLAEIDNRTNRRYAEVLARIADSMAGLTSRVAPTGCHGDLTLENMIFRSDGRVALIDPIPAPVEHYWFDIAKIFQDLEGRWYLNRKRHLQFGVSACVADIIIDAIAAIDADYFALHRPMLALSFARILPYCTSAEEEEFVHGRVLAALDSRTCEPGRKNANWSLTQ